MDRIKSIRLANDDPKTLRKVLAIVREYNKLPVQAHVDESMARGQHEKTRGWREFMAGIPFLSFPAGWQVAVIPPFAGADARFRVREGNAEVSVYLDLHQNLGCYDGPYWEVYPHDNDVARCDMADGEALVRLIAESLAEQGAQA